MKPTKKEVIKAIKRNENLQIIKIGRGWIDIRSFSNGITMRWWNFMWDLLIKKYKV